MSIQSLFLVFICALCTAFAQALFKAGLTLSDFGLNVRTIHHVLTTPALVLGLVVYFVAIYSWLKVLTSSEISVAFPIQVGLSFVLTLVVAALKFGEALSFFKIIGILLILVGIIVILEA
jgi:multidrug transporter EmrE-like cation transporter